MISAARARRLVGLYTRDADLADPRQLAQVNPGDAVELTPEGNRLIATSNGIRIGVVEPRVAARLLKLIADGNKYAAGVTSLGDKDVRIIIREVYQDPRNYGKVSFPTAAKSTDLRPYTKGTLVREEMELEEDLEDDEEDEEIEDLRALMAHLAIEQAHVVGFSMGAYVALDGRLPDFPDHDVALLWNELTGWSAAVEDRRGERLAHQRDRPGHR